MTQPNVHDDEARDIGESRGMNRRGFLAATGATGAAVLAASVIGASPVAAATRKAGMVPRAAKPNAKTDLATAAFAASLEVLAVGTYGAALDAANSGALGAVPPAVAQFVSSAKDQHQEYLDALNGVLSGAGMPEVTEPDPTLKKVVDGRFAGVKDVAGAATLARDLEEIASATYLKAIPTLTGPTAVTAGSILCVGQQRVATLNFALGKYPVPDTFAKTTKAAAPA